MNRGIWTAAVLYLAAGWSGCKQDDQTPEVQRLSAPAAAPSDKLTADQEYVAARLKENLAEAKAKLAAGDDPKFSCVSVLTYSEQLTNITIEEVKTLVKDAQQACGHDIPLTFVEKTLTQIESAPPTDPPTAFVGECASVEFLLADLMPRHPNDSAIAAANERFKKRCKAEP